MEKGFYQLVNLIESNLYFKITTTIIMAFLLIYIGYICGNWLGDKTFK